MVPTVSVQASFWFFFALQLLSYTQLSEATQHLETPSEKIVEICRAICSQSPVHPKVTFVFTLHVPEEHKYSYNHLWSLPNSLVYLSEQYIALGREDRLIEISWERNNRIFGDRPRDGLCGIRDCRDSERNLELFHRERRVLIQVLSLLKNEWPQLIWQKLWLDARNMTRPLTYRSTFFFVKVPGEDVVHSSYSIQPWPNAPHKQLRYMTVFQHHTRVEKVFDSTEKVLNLSIRLELRLTLINLFLPETVANIGVQRCAFVSIL